MPVMGIFRRKPIEVEAFKVVRGDALPEWVPTWVWAGDAVVIRMQEKDARAVFVGDYIIRLPSGEVKVCKIEDFHENYEKL